LPCRVTTLTGCRFYLGADPVDDWILEHVSRTLVEVYFPESLKRLPEDFLFLEVGAHHGFVTVELLRRFPKARVIAVEPNPEAVRILRRNLGANGMLNRVEIVEAGIGAKDGNGCLKPSAHGSWGDTVEEIHRNGSGIPVPLLTVPSILKGRKPDVVKSNAEGAEYELFPQIFSNGIHPQLVILMPHAIRGQIDALRALLAGEGYSIYDLGTGDAESPHWHCTYRSGNESNSTFSEHAGG
jgi:FkbM family methyltransferase